MKGIPHSVLRSQTITFDKRGWASRTFVAVLTTNDNHELTNVNFKLTSVVFLIEIRKPKSTIMIDTFKKRHVYLSISLKHMATRKVYQPNLR
jgi:hypothetical protein